MTIDHKVCAAARHFDQEQLIGPLEDDMLVALEAHDQTHAAWNATRKALAPLFARVLSAWLYPGAVIDTHDRTGKLPRCLWSVRVGSGNARSATKFRIIGVPSVRVEDEGDPSMSEWSVRAIAISSKTGLDMSGNTPNRRTLTDGSVTLTGHVFHMGFSDLRGDALRQSARSSATTSSPWLPRPKRSSLSERSRAPDDQRKRFRPSGCWDRGSTERNAKADTVAAEIKALLKRQGLRCVILKAAECAKSSAANAR